MTPRVGRQPPKFSAPATLASGKLVEEFHLHSEATGL